MGGCSCPRMGGNVGGSVAGPKAFTWPDYQTTRVCVCARVRVCMCVCLRESEREKEGTTPRKHIITAKMTIFLNIHSTFPKSPVHLFPDFLLFLPSSCVLG